MGCPQQQESLLRAESLKQKFVEEPLPSQVKLQGHLHQRCQQDSGQMDSTGREVKNFGPARDFFDGSARQKDPSG